MIRGSIILDKIPAVIIPVGIGDIVQDLTVFIDTGFTGYIKMPLEKADEFNVEITHTVNIELADKSTAHAGVGRVNVAIDGQTKEVEVIVQDGDILIGVGLLRKFCAILKIDFGSNTIELERKS